MITEFFLTVNSEIHGVYYSYPCSESDNEKHEYEGDREIHTGMYQSDRIEFAEEHGIVFAIEAGTYEAEDGLTICSVDTVYFKDAQSMAKFQLLYL